MSIPFLLLLPKRRNMEKARILIVEDDIEPNYIMRMEKKGYQIFQAATGKEAEILLKKEDIDLILLDTMLPDEDGVEFCRRIRKESIIPIIFVSCIGERETVMEALKNGGDDFVTKPVDIEVLSARIESNLRRSRIYQRNDYEKKTVKTFRQFAVDLSRHQVWRVNEEGKREGKLHLSPLEYKLLEMFVNNEGKLMTYEEIYQYIWKSDDLGDVRTVMVHVSNLRKKVSRLGSGMIQTVRGAGYVFYNR